MATKSVEDTFGTIANTVISVKSVSYTLHSVKKCFIRAMHLFLLLMVLSTLAHRWIPDTLR